MSANDYVAVVDGVEMLSITGLGLVCGLTADEAHAEYTRQQSIRPGRFVVPQSWLRRSKELQAKHGTSDFGELVARILEGALS